MKAFGFPVLKKSLCCREVRLGEFEYLEIYEGLSSQFPNLSVSSVFPNSLQDGIVL